MNGGHAFVRKPSTCLYLVLQSRGAWWVDREGKSLGPYETRDEAESGAFHLIELFGDPARPIEVWSCDDNGKMVLVWKGGMQPEWSADAATTSDKPESSSASSDQELAAPDEADRGPTSLP